MGKVLISLAAVGAAVLVSAQLTLSVWAGTTLGEAAVAWTAAAGLEATGASAESDDAEWQYFDEEHTYTVTGDATLDAATDDEALSAWDLFRRVAGDDMIVAHVGSFVVGDDPDSDFSAYVRPEAEGRWALVVNLAVDDSYELAVTMIHEYAHLLSLNSTQVDPDVDWSRCGETWIFEGCPEDDAVIARFQDSFWDMYGYDVPDGIAGASDVEEFWSAREEQFVSEYAATSVVEDFAESFTTWVLLEGAPPARFGFDGLAADKVDFFDSDPAVIGERDRILAAIQPELYG